MNYYCVAVSMAKPISGGNHIQTFLGIREANSRDEARGMMVKSALEEYPDYKIGHTVEMEVFK